VNQDWSAVSDAIKDRLDERGMTMTDLASKSGVSLTTVRELVHVLNTRRRQPRTLVALSQALGWPADHLGAVLRGRPADADRNDERADVREELRDLRRRVEALERAAGTTL
jgi:transcriptional regulator with XRE-family HTH domain